MAHKVIRDKEVLSEEIIVFLMETMEDSLEDLVLKDLEVVDLVLDLEVVDLVLDLFKRAVDMQGPGMTKVTELLKQAVDMEAQGKAKVIKLFKQALDMEGPGMTMPEGEMDSMEDLEEEEMVAMDLMEDLGVELMMAVKL